MSYFSLEHSHLMGQLVYPFQQFATAHDADAFAEMGDDSEVVADHE